eukprot:TRINITY_DN306_c2_g1_i1.p1 TRINITY_DN306_c2_g1~~TRINITY_DN306_c2_g1_i1.p1  ORF type:complete len:479 (-),score=48.18 TRINITY_DN306_c2_g1_i1:6-1442(-)
MPGKLAKQKFQPTGSPLDDGRETPTSRSSVTLTPQEVATCRTLFTEGYRIDGIARLTEILEQLNVPPLDNTLLGRYFTNGPLDINDFIEVVQACKGRFLRSRSRDTRQEDLLDVFVSLGGRVDQTGVIDTKLLKSIVEEFKLDINIDKFIQETDMDGNTDIDFNEFVVLLTADHTTIADDFVRLVQATGSTLPEKISVDRLRQLIAEKGSAHAPILESVIEEMDVDRDALIDLGEFTRALLHNQQRLAEAEKRHRQSKAGEADVDRYGKLARATSLLGRLPLTQEPADTTNAAPTEEDLTSAREHQRLDAIMARHDRNIDAITRATRGPRYHRQRPATRWLRRRDPTPDYLLPRAMLSSAGTDTGEDPPTAGGSLPAEDDDYLSEEPDDETAMTEEPVPEESRASAAPSAASDRSSARSAVKSAASSRPSSHAKSVAESENVEKSASHAGSSRSRTTPTSSRARSDSERSGSDDDDDA